MNFKKVPLIAILVSMSFLLTPFCKVQARDTSQITDWYIKSFTSEITVNTDSSLDITEKIEADCGNLANKHGIFRILPTAYSPSSGQWVNTPVELKSITDFKGTPYQYSTTTSRSDHTITWKIGDADTIVHGVNNYQINYHVKNTIRFTDSNFDEFYWNLNGNFWQLQTDSYTAVINFPKGIDQTHYKELNLYSGQFGSNNQIATSNWTGENQLTVQSARMLNEGEGITLSLTFNKGIITPYEPTFWEKNGKYFFFLLPILSLILAYLLWNKFGRDPKINPTVAPEFEIPEKLQPMEMGVAYSDGVLKSEYISAALINLAVKKVVKIEEITSGTIFKHKDYKLILLNETKENISQAEKSLLNDVFGGQSEILLSSLRNQFYKNIPDLTRQIKNDLVGRNLLIASSRVWQIAFWGTMGVLFSLAFYSFVLNPYLGLNLILSGLVFLVFSFLMTKRTPEGLKLYKRIEGFKLYMNTAEKYRQRFNEKENIFEKFLPYAIMFGMTGIWIAKMKQIYGEDYFNSYHPIWFYGANLASFNADSLNSAISSISSNMASTLASSPSSSGSGGGGFSGGGGGGGGGGGW